MIKGLVSIILPTTGRSELALNCIRQLLKTTPNQSIELICPIDVDRVTYDAFEQFLSQYKDSNLFAYKLLWFDEYRGVEPSWNAGLKLARGEFIMAAADDLWWYDGWLDIALEAMQTLPEGGGVVGLNDTHTDGTWFATHWIASRWFVLNYMNGVMAYPCYVTCFHDTETSERAKLAGRYVFAEKAIARHDHPTWGTREEDDTGRRMKYEGYWEIELACFTERKEQGFPNDFEPVIQE